MVSNYKEELLNDYYQVNSLLRNSLFSILFYKNNYQLIIKDFINITDNNNYIMQFLEKINLQLGE